MKNFKLLKGRKYKTYTINISFDPATNTELITRTTFIRPNSRVTEVLYHSSNSQFANYINVVLLNFTETVPHTFHSYCGTFITFLEEINQLDDVMVYEIHTSDGSVYRMNNPLPVFLPDERVTILWCEGQ